MPWAVGVLAIFAATLASAMLLSVWLMNRAGEWLVGRKHRDLEAVYETGAVPASWRRHRARQLAQVGRNPRGAARRAALQGRAKADYLRRLDGLLTYVEHSGLVEDSEAREELLARLRQVRREWEERDPGEL